MEQQLGILPMYNRSSSDQAANSEEEYYDPDAYKFNFLKLKKYNYNEMTDPADSTMIVRGIDSVFYYPENEVVGRR